MAMLRVNTVVKKDGEITMRGLPFKKGDRVELILHPAEAAANAKVLTARRLRGSGLIGLWKKRADVTDSAVFARQLRQQAQRRSK